ncbi:MAG: hypothetical protein AVDCRST_MAG55-3313 [uncultured Rubrobacteraceae bacterium]|uniref:Uncharacterized protein n=1 Tax=uncultured Rubrobacteraceae bacterium TaxID=349277 RepID=A0A6J4QC07_9ACTN|nr:MAG: hypothetical protein AVDCRST_MAG55-3313 [uncultured Rubrobacteraceae bacterium]
MDVRRIVGRIRMSPYGERRIGVTLDNLGGRDERRDVGRQEEGSNTGPYVLLALALAFAGFGISIGITSGVLVPVFVFMFPALVLLALGVSRLQQQGRVFISSGTGTERELLSAIRDNGGSISPAEAAMNTSLTVREADGMLSELAGGGHLAVESRGGALFYSLPGRPAAGLEDR